MSEIATDPFAVEEQDDQLFPDEAQNSYNDNPDGLSTAPAAPVGGVADCTNAPPPPVGPTPENDVFPPGPVYTAEERRAMENQETAAIIYSIMDRSDQKLLQFFSRPHLMALIVRKKGELNLGRLAIYLGEDPDQVLSRVQKLIDIGALFRDPESLVVNTKVTQFISSIAPTY